MGNTWFYNGYKYTEFFRIFAGTFHIRQDELIKFFSKREMFEQKIDDEKVRQLPLLVFRGKIEVIDSLGHEFERAVRYLRHRSVIGFDTETRPVFSNRAPSNGVALLQLSSGKRAFLFRVNLIGMPEKLAEILSSENIIKVGAAVADDIKGLQKIYPFKPAGFVDLQQIATEWGIEEKSVKKLAAIIMKGRVSKTQQLSNWEAPRYSEAQLNYAATDAWVCREMYRILCENPKVTK